MEVDAKPLEKSSKGTLLRGVAEKRFEANIEKAYGDGDDSHASNLEFDDSEVLLTVRNIVEDVMQGSRMLNDTDDFYQHGVDSVKATQIRNAIQKVSYFTFVPVIED